jgi:type VI protein secretion system component VasF
LQSALELSRMSEASEKLILLARRINVEERDAAQKNQAPGARERTKGDLMLWTIFVILLVLWLLGFGFHVAGSLIHLLLVVALIVLVINLVSGRTAV